MSPIFAHDTFVSIFGAARAGEQEITTSLVRAALREGYAIVLNEPGTKKPLCTLAAAGRKKADREAQDAAAERGEPNASKVRHACGVHHALTEADTGKVKTLIDRVTAQYGAPPNIGVEPGRSRMIAVDVDTAAERDAFLAVWAAEMPDSPPPAYTVLTPGAMREDGTWVHSEGGHYWFRVPAGIDLPDGHGVLKDESGWTAAWRDRQLLVPPSVRAEGPYVCVGMPLDAPGWLTDRVFTYDQERAERERIRLEQQAQRRQSGEVDPVDAWAQDTPWAELLEPRGWVETGLVDTCSCPTWTAPGPHGSPKSATAHDEGCTRFDSDDGHAPLHVWTDNPPEYLADAVRTSRTMTKLTHEAYASFEGSESAAVVGLGLASSADREALAAAAAELDEFKASLGAAVASDEGPTESEDPTPAPADQDEFATPAQLDQGDSTESARDGDAPDAPGPWFRRSELKLIQPPEPLIAGGVLDHRTMVVLAGKYGTYKTFLALDWAASLATGTPWAGFAVPQAVPVVYIAAEGAGSFDRRLSAWEEAHRGGSLIPDTQLLIHGGPVNVGKNEDMSGVVASMKEIGAKVLVVDTLSRCAPGLEENEASKVAAALERLFMIRDALGVTVVVLHHTGHQGLRARGSSVLEDNADASWVIRLNGDGTGEDRGADVPRTLMHRKIKDGEIIADRPLALKPAGDSAYLSYDAFDAPVSARKAAERAGEEAEMLTDLRGKKIDKELSARAVAREMGWNWDRKIVRSTVTKYLNE